MGIPAALYAAGFGLAISGGTYFWPGITIGFVATIIFAASCWVESRAWTLRERLFPFAGVIFLFGPIAWVAFHPASIKVLFQLRDSNYPRGTKIAGIEWKDDLTDLCVFIRNETADDYSNLDLTIRTDLIIAGIGVINNFGQCAFDAVSDAKIVELKGVDDKGNKITIPLAPVPSIQKIASIYRIRCDKLIAKSEIEVVLGLLSLSSFGNDNPVDPRTKPS